MCKQCQQPLPADAPEGLCPACLAKVALGSEGAAPGATANLNPLAGPAAPGARLPPDPAQLAANFPQLEIIELLGMGGMGMVYKARQARLDRLVALKVLPMESVPHPTFAERFNREARALAKLNHPGIVNIYDFGQTNQYYYFIMEYVDGMNLRQLLDNQPLIPRQALELVVQVCTALQYAHDEGVVHRDIKPENILITKKGQVKIADFGLAKLLGNAPDTTLTVSQAAMGTLNYMAPEQRQNAQGVDHRADIYSLGVVFYEMLTGEVPMGRFDPPSKKVQVDVRLDEVVLRALEREPARRYQQVSEIKTGVDTITSTNPAVPGAAPDAPVPGNPAPRFVDWIVKPMMGLAVVSWLFTTVGRGWLNVLGSVLLTYVPPCLFFVWRYQAASRGLHLWQLPPEVRRRGNWRAGRLMAAFLAVILVEMTAFGSASGDFLPFLFGSSCVYFLLLLRSLKRTLAKGRAEIEAGRWTPPTAAPTLWRQALDLWHAWVPLGVVVASVAVLLVKDLFSAVLLLLIGFGALTVVVLELYWRRQIQQARERGLWPPLGEFPSLEHVRGLAQAGEKRLAIKLYRRIHGVSLAESRAVVEKLAGH
ncbi:MAG TPA: protein kinase [Candidatus Acidoferrum sp.]|nr:protein kinase [Candidatus Acidoferrum sp.]